MRDEVRPGPGWSWVNVGAIEDGQPLVVPSLLRVTRYDDEDRAALRLDVIVRPKHGGGWEHGVTGLEVLGDEDHLVSASALRGLGLEGVLPEVVREQVRAVTPARVEGHGFQAVAESVEQATYEQVSDDEAAAAQGRASSLRVSRRERRESIDEAVERAAQLYREAREVHTDTGKARPVEHVAAAMGLSRRTAARRIEEARRAGHLPPTTKGVPKA